MEKKLGKISNVTFGCVGYQDVQFGLSLTFEGQGWGVGTTISHAWSLGMKCDKHSKWTEADRDAGFAKTMREVNEIMQKARIDDITKLKGKPVEVVFANNTLQSWRILEEVL
jgi:hypothetical protein